MRTTFTLLLALVACGGGATESSDTTTEPAPTGTAGAEEPHSHPPFEYQGVVDALDDIDTPIRPQWESEVREILLDTYDDDDSGELDTDGEIDDVPCEVWRAVDDGYRDRATGDDSVRDAYGFAPDTLYIDALGVDRGQRERLRVKLVDCGVR